MAFVEHVRAYLDAFALRDPDAIAAHVSVSFVNEHTSALGSSSVGRDEYRSRLPGFLGMFDGLAYEIEDLVADGPLVFAAYRMRATFETHPIDIRGVMRFDIDGDGLIARRVDYWDSLTFLRQTGQT